MRTTHIGLAFVVSTLLVSVSQTHAQTEFPSSSESQNECQTFFNFQTQQEEESCPDQTGSSSSEQTTDFVGSLSDLISLGRGEFGRPGGNNRTVANGRVFGGAAGDDMTDSGRLSPFAVVNYSDADRRATDSGLAYEQEANALLFGFDYRFNNDLIAGATLSYLDAETEFDNDRGGNDNKTYLLGFHASKYWDQAFLDALITYGQVDLDIDRVSASTLFEGDTDGDFHSAELSFGINHSHKRLRLTPTVRLLHVRGELDGYTETSSGFGALTFEDQPFESLNARAALQADYVFLMDWGVLIPSANFAYHHEYIGAERVTSSTGGFTIQQITDDPERNYKQGRLGISAQFQDGLAAFLTYERLIDHSFLDRDSFSLGVRYELP